MYINSLITSSFSRAVFSISTNSKTPMLYQQFLTNIQHVFSFMKSSFRSAFSPAVFIKTCRPPWFVPGAQQDCSEFLR